jgi:NADH:ubiquinone oxidoreductase subunit 2 (subunit N)
MHLLAYVDPGAGALVWQFVVAAAVGAMFYIRKMRRLIAAFFKKAVGIRRNDKQPETTQNISQRTYEKDPG